MTTEFFNELDIILFLKKNTTYPATPQAATSPTRLLMFDLFHPYRRSWFNGRQQMGNAKMPG